ncbi:hypothetical protein SCOR_31375 [Sulfidibacter corallicola]
MCDKDSAYFRLSETNPFGGRPTRPAQPAGEMPGARSRMSFARTRRAKIECCQIEIEESL